MYTQQSQTSELGVGHSTCAVLSIPGTDLRVPVAGISLVLIFSHLNHERWQIVFCIVVQIALTGSLASLGINDDAQAVATVFILSCFVNQPLFLSFSVISLALEDQTDM